MRTRHLILAASLLLAANLCAQDESQVTTLLKQLQSRDIETRRDAIGALHTSLDPRIPDACLPLFEQEGDTIHRLAARAIGSRWHQIPKERVPVFTAALKAQLKREQEDIVNMARRGIALLDRDYTGTMVSRSKSKRWVIYERYGLPCLIDTQTMTEELLGFPSEAKMSCAWGNSELAPSVKWHPKKDMVALDILQGRKLSTVWLWLHGKGLRQLSLEEQVKALGHKEDDIAGAAGFYTEITGWNGDNLDFNLNYAVIKGDDFIDHEARLRWNSATDKVSVLSDKVVQ